MLLPVLVVFAMQLMALSPQILKSNRLQPDSLRISRAALVRPLNEPAACSPQPQDAISWAPAHVTQAGQAVFLPDNTLAVVDLDANAVRLYGNDGRQLA